MWQGFYNRPLKVDEPTLKAIIWASAAVAFPFVPFRLFVRWKVMKKLLIDDILVVVAYCFLLAYAILWQNFAHDFYLVFESNSRRIKPPKDIDHHTKRELNAQVISVILYGLCLWCIKLAFLFFFQKLGNHTQSQRITWWSVLAYNVVAFAIWIAVPPWRCITASSPKVLMATCGDEATARFLQNSLKVQATMDVTSDVAIIILPLCLLWNLKVDLRKKLILGGIFSLTVFTMVASIVRVVVVTSEGMVLDETWKVTWIGIEMGVAIIVACLGSFRALYTTQRLSKGSDQRPLARPVVSVNRKPEHQSSSELGVKTETTKMSLREVERGW